MNCGSAARIPFPQVANLPAVLDDFAQSVAAEIRECNRRGEPTRLILPVGPVAQYPILVELCQQEAINWGTVHLFQMDEWLDWQGRPISVTHPLSFEGFPRRELYAHVVIAADHIHVPDPFRLDEIAARSEGSWQGFER